jgi:hypothetical protein
MTQMAWLDPLIYKNQLVHKFRRTPGMTILGFVTKSIHERIGKTAEAKDVACVKCGHKDFLARFLEIHKAKSTYHYGREK